MNGRLKSLIGCLGLGMAVACGGGATTLDVRDDAVADPTAEIADGAPEIAEPAVLFQTDLGATPPCADPAHCGDDYLAFVDLAAAYARPVPIDAIHQQLVDIDAGQVPLVPGPLSADDLAAAIVDGLNIAFLLDGLDARPLTATTIGFTETADHAETHLLLQDPWVGTVEALLLTPPGPGPFPAVLAVHGHGDTIAMYRDDYHGIEYPGHGLAILIVQMRAMGAGAAETYEDKVTKALMVQGFQLMGVRVYESLLGFKLLRALPTIDSGRVGLIGHSGGSSTGNLTVRLEPRLKAYVSDYQVAYAEWPAPFPLYHCETVPALFPYSALINDATTSAVPTLKVPYKYAEGMQGIFAFFAERLGP